MGALSVVYLVIIEIMLKALCPLCTLVHVLIIGVLVSSVWWKKEMSVQHSWREVWRAGKNFWLGGLVFIGVLFLSFNFSPEKVNQDALAQCLTEKGAVMYGSFTCGHCLAQKKMFGDSFRYVNYVECHPRGPNSQYQLCSQKAIQGTPTWTLEREGVELKRYVGFLSLEELKQFGGCL